MQVVVRPVDQSTARGGREEATSLPWPWPCSPEAPHLQLH